MAPRLNGRKSGVKVPSVARLEAAFPGCGKMLRHVMDGTDKPERYKEVEIWLKLCHNPPDKYLKIMRAIDCIIEGHGVESIQRRGVFGRPDALYINTDDTYNTTIIWDDDRSAWFIETWADFVEKAGRRGIKFGDEE